MLGLLTSLVIIKKEDCMKINRHHLKNTQKKVMKTANKETMVQPDEGKQIIQMKKQSKPIKPMVIKRKFNPI
jgi:hypothetical protein